MTAIWTIIDASSEGLHSQEHMLCLRPSSIEEGTVLASELFNRGDRRPATAYLSALTITFILATVIGTLG